MSIREQIDGDLNEAVREGDSTRRDVLRMLKARFLEAEVELRGKRGRDYRLNDSEAEDVILQYAKQRRQSIEAYREAGRDDLATREESELGILEPYLPKQLTSDELETIVRQAIESTSATSLRDIGRVMKEVMSQVKGKADGKTVNQMVRKLLGEV